MFDRRTALFGMGACALCGCSGALHRLPNLESSHLSLASTEIGAGAPTARRVVTDEEVLATLRNAHARLLGPATGVCREIGSGVCEWKFRAKRDGTMNAYASGDGSIVVHRGIVEYAQSDDEVAFVLAHEIGHHASNHIRQTRRSAAVGAAIGGLLLGGLAIAAGAHAGGGYNAQVAAQNATEAGLKAGAAVGRISFSKEQEREADYVAAVILHRAGYDLQKARGFLVTLARASSRRESGLLDTHPAGPERLAAYDRAVAEFDGPEFESLLAAARPSH